MARTHLMSSFVLLLPLLTQMLPTQGRDIKSPTIKIDPVSTNFHETVTPDNSFPSLKPNSNIQKSSRKVYSFHVNKYANDLESLDNYHLRVTGHGDIHPIMHSSPSVLIPGKISTNYKPKNPKTWERRQVFSVDPRHRTPGHDHAKKNRNKSNKYFPPRSPTSSSFFSASNMAHANDFRPTVPGISPGAGHADTNKNDKEESRNCLNDKCTEDFRPTAPGDSPGAGHSFVNNKSKVSEPRKYPGMAHTEAGQTDDYRPTAPGHSPGAGHPSIEKTIHYSSHL